MVPVADALESGLPLLALKAQALRAVLALVPAGGAWFVTLNRRRTLEQAVVMETESFSVPLLERWRRYAVEWGHGDPLSPERLPDRGAPVATLEDVGADEAFRAFLADIGIRDRLSMYIRVSGSPAAVLSLVRGHDTEPFTRRDVVNARRLQPLVEHAYVGAIERRVDDVRDALRRGGLSEREAEVAELVGRGATNAGAARALHISESTVKTHLTRAYAKLGVTSRTQLAILAGADGHVADASRRS